MSNLKTVNLSIRMKDVKDQIDALADAKKELQKEYDKIRFTELPDAMDDEGVENMRVTGVGTVYLTDDINVSITCEKDYMYGWMDRNDFGDLIKPYVFPQTLKAWVKEQLQLGNELPDDLIKVTPFTRAAIKATK